MGEQSAEDDLIDNKDGISKPLHKTKMSRLVLDNEVVAFHALSNGYEHNHVSVQQQLVKDGSPIGKTYGLGDNEMHAQSSITVVTELQPGNSVWVRIYAPADASYWGDGYTSFTGVLLQAFKWISNDIP
ncbi:hypothetical protein MAR_008439, partial [Mya arenaria]